MTKIMKRLITILMMGLALILCGETAMAQKSLPKPSTVKKSKTTKTTKTTKGNTSKKNTTKTQPKQKDGNGSENIKNSNTVSWSDADNAIHFGGNTYKMILVPAGTFHMGSNDSEAENNEKTIHRVTLSDYYIGETEVTQELWKAVMDWNPSQFTGQSNLPVESVSWNECQEFIIKLNKLTGKTFSLPTEAEWEYAARGGNASIGYRYSGGDNINNVAWMSDNSGNKTHPVKGKKPNELGLYDMTGNVWEWCSDWYGDYPSSWETNPTGPASGSRRVLRGGSWDYSARYCRVAFRNYLTPGDSRDFLGLRLRLRP